MFTHCFVSWQFCAEQCSAFSENSCLQLYDKMLLESHFSKLYTPVPHKPPRPQQQTWSESIFRLKEQTQTEHV